MSLPTLLAFLLFLAAAYLVSRPLVLPGSETANERERENEVSSALVSRKDRLLGAVREMDMDFVMGKLSEEDYRALRSKTVTEAAQVLREVELSSVALADPVPPSRAEKAPATRDMRDRLSSSPSAELGVVPEGGGGNVSVGARAAADLPGSESDLSMGAPNQQGSPAPGAESPDDHLERLIASRRWTLKSSTCPSCGAKRDPSDKFCRSCGSRLSQADVGER